jgi:hypothetical protein
MEEISIRVLVKYKVKISPTISLSKKFKFKDKILKQEQKVLNVQEHTYKAIISKLQSYYPDQEILLLSVDWVGEIPQEKGGSWYEILTPMS